jgi:lambda family phage portal protein
MAAFGGSGGYEGARTDSRALKRWRPGLGSANADTNADLPELRARARDLDRNSPIAAGATNTAVTYAVGTGLWPHPRIDREVLGLSDDEADAWERQAARIFALWDQRADIAGRLSFTGLTSLGFRSHLVSGDVLVIRRFRERAGDLLGLKLQLVEADRISNPNQTYDTERLISGVEFDPDGMPVRYHVRSRHPGDCFWGASDTWTSVPAIGGATGEKLALLVYRQIRPDQVRGVPSLATVIERVKELDRYSKAEVAAAVIAAFFTVFIKSQSAELGLGSLDPATGLAESARQGKDDVFLSEGGIANLAPGEDITIANPGRPNAQFEPFFMAMATEIGVGIDMPPEVLLKRFNASYSASRASFLEAWRAVTTRRAWLVDTFCQPVYGWAISEAVARGYLNAPGFFEDPLVREAWLGTKWVGDSMGQIDPRSETDAAIEKIGAGLSTLEDETAQLNGGDWEKNHAQQVKEHRMRQRDGLAAAVATQQPSSQDPQPGPNEQDQSRPPKQQQAARIRNPETQMTALSGSGPQP